MLVRIERASLNNAILEFAADLGNVSGTNGQKNPVFSTLFPIRSVEVPELFQCPSSTSWQNLGDPKSLEGTEYETLLDALAAIDGQYTPGSVAFSGYPIGPLHWAPRTVTEQYTEFRDIIIGSGGTEESLWDMAESNYSTYASQWPCLYGGISAVSGGWRLGFHYGIQYDNSPEQASFSYVYTSNDLDPAYEAAALPPFFVLSIDPDGEPGPTETPDPDPLPEDVEDVFDEQDELNPSPSEPSPTGSHTPESPGAPPIYSSTIGNQDPCFAVRLRRTDVTGVLGGNLEYLRRLLRTFIPVGETKESYPIQGPIHLGGQPLTNVAPAEDDYDAVQLAQLNTL